MTAAVHDSLHDWRRVLFLSEKSDRFCLLAFWGKACIRLIQPGQPYQGNSVDVQTELEKLMLVRQTLERTQEAAYRDLLFVQSRVSECQAGCRQILAHNQVLQQAVARLTAVSTCPCTSTMQMCICHLVPALQTC